MSNVRSPAQEELFVASGKVESRNRLVNFLYLLMRDHVPTGTVGSLMNESEQPKEGEIDKWKRGEEQEWNFNFTNGWLAKYATHCADRLNGPRSEEDRLKGKIEALKKELEDTKRELRFKEEFIKQWDVESEAARSALGELCLWIRYVHRNGVQVPVSSAQASLMRTGEAWMKASNRPITFAHDKEDQP